MIESPRPSVKPEQDLARLALMDERKEIRVRTMSMTSGHRPSLGQGAQGPSGLGTLNGVAIAGPLGPPQPTQPSMITEASQPLMSPSALTSIEEQIPDMPSGTQNSSEATLVSNKDPDEMMVDDLQNPETEEQQRKVLNDKENLPPHKSEETGAHATEDGGPLAESSPSKINAQAGHSHPPSEDSGIDVHETKPESIVGPPNRPPPVPPRPVQTQSLQKTIEEAAQQDVGEVIKNVLFQLCCAIKPLGTAEDGEQVDQIGSLFYGTKNTFTKAPGKTPSTKVERYSDLAVNVVTGPKDVYEALDGYFDRQDVELSGLTQQHWTSLVKVPDILQVTVVRTQWDMAQQKAYKSNYHLKPLETIYLDRYLEASDESSLMERRRQCWEWKNELARLEARQKELEEGPVMLPDVSSLVSMTS